VLLFSQFAGAADGRFGGAGQIAISSDLLLSIQAASTKPPGGEATSSTTIVVRPSADYFVIDSLSVGGLVGFGYTKAEASKLTTWEIGPRVGYGVALAETVSLWPKLGLVYRSATSSTTVDATDRMLSLQFVAPILLHLVPHFFVGFGPDFSIDLTSSRTIAGQSSDGSKTTTIGLESVIGGWF